MDRIAYGIDRVQGVTGRFGPHTPEIAATVIAKGRMSADADADADDRDSLRDVPACCRMRTPAVRSVAGACESETVEKGPSQGWRQPSVSGIGRCSSIVSIAKNEVTVSSSTLEISRR
jgi:hypothetical protein